jgi:N5-(cytidine 5'-diphosphoramidyl)-L-glutamine hydrolase
MKKILISQRLDKIGNHKELRDNLDVRFYSFFKKCGLTLIPVPNDLKNFNKFIKLIKPNGIVLSPGGDSKKKDIRFSTEKKLVQYSLKKNVPLMGICRGAQFINNYFGGKLVKIKNHVRQNHRIFGKITNNLVIKVNSFHDFAIDRKTLYQDFEVHAYAKDKSIECFKHKSKKIMGIMWHPERYKSIKAFDKKIIKNLF